MLAGKWSEGFALDLWPEDSAPLYDVVETDVAVPQNTVTPLVIAKPARVALFFNAAAAGTTIRISTKNTVTGATGFALTGNFPSFAFEVRETSPLAALQWFAFQANPGSPTVNVIELILSRPSTRPDRHALPSAAAGPRSLRDVLVKYLAEQQRWRRGRFGRQGMVMNGAT